VPELKELKDDIHGLGLEVAELKPLVREVHNYMPRIAEALVTLARITEKLESNTEDHKRIHHRITDLENGVRGVETDFKDLSIVTANNQGRLEEKFNKLRDEHLECMTAKRVEKVERRKGMFNRIKAKFEERVVDILVWLLISFTVWMVLNHMVLYSSSGLAGAVKKAAGGG